MGNVTYLFGAGASASPHCLPLVSQIPEKLKAFAEELDKHGEPNSMVETFSLHRENLIREIGEVYTDLTWIRLLNDGAYEVVLKHASVDTYAKKLFILNRNNELSKLKRVLTLLFMYEQTVHEIDPRYDSFFSSIIRNDSSKLPSTIKIVTWNYDSQFELAYRDYCETVGVGADERYDSQMIRGKLGIVTKHLTKSIGHAGFGIYKVNGTASIYDKLTLAEIKTLREEKRSEHQEHQYDMLYRCYGILTQKDSNFECALSYAWEPDPHNILDSISKQLKGSNTLAIIGYSVPFFNREVDQKLLDEVKLTKVYIQDKDPESIRDRFKAIKGGSKIEFELSDKVDQFILPNELSLQ